MTVTIQSE